MGLLKKLVAITLLVLLGLPFVASAFALAPKSDASLPACCRKNGKHHCMMSAAERARMSDGVVRVSAPLEKCPFAPQMTPNAHVVSWTPMSERRWVALAVRESTVVEQAECLRRVSRDRARQKRGPPVLSLL